MGRIVNLCGEIAAAAEEGPEGLMLSPDEWERLQQDFSEDEIEDALQLVRENLLQGELIDASDSLSARLLDVFNALGEPAAFDAAATHGLNLSIETVSHLVRRVARLEEILEVFRDGVPPDRRGFDALQRRLADLGIEEEMASEPERGNGHDEEEDD